MQLLHPFVSVGGEDAGIVFLISRVEWEDGAQDRVPAFSADKAEALIAKELGAPVEMLFRSFEKRPIAAASLGQVCGWAGRMGLGKAAMVGTEH